MIEHFQEILMIIVLCSFVLILTLNVYQFYRAEYFLIVKSSFSQFLFFSVTFIKFIYK